MRNLTENEQKTILGLHSVSSAVNVWFSQNKYLARDASKDPNMFGRFYIWYTEIPRKKLKEETGIQIPMFKERLLQQAFEIYVADGLAADLPAATAKFMNNPENLGPLHVWIKAVTGAQDPKNIAVMAHWLWQIKRKAKSQPVIYHLMPVLKGEQNSGKSTAVRKLISPIEKFKLSLPMTDLGDSRTYPGLATNLVVFFDELHGIERVNMNMLKQKITADENSYRKLNTHCMVNIPMMASFIGCSNKPINELIFDHTGMRRFYQINTLDLIDWATIDCIDYATLLNGIDETKENGYVVNEILTEVQNVQRSLINPDDLELFIDAVKLKGVDTKNRKAKSKTMFKAFLQWKYDTNSSWNPQLDAFIARLRNRDVPYEKINEDLYFTLSDNCTIVEESVKPEHAVLKFKKE